MRHIPLKGAGIHIDRSQCFRVVDDERAAGRERYFAIEECFHLLIDMAGMEERLLSFIAADLFCGESFSFRKLHQTLKGRPVIGDQAFDVRRHVVTQTFHREVAVTVEELRRLLHLEATADDLSDGRKRRQIAPKLFRLRLFCRGAHDGSHTGRTYVARHSSERCAFLFASDLLGDPDIVRCKESHRIFSSKGDLLRQERTFRLCAVLLHLHKDRCPLGMRLF